MSRQPPLRSTSANLATAPASCTSPVAASANVAFRTTRWTQVVAARGDSAPARQALSDLCAAYYEPVVTYLRCEGRPDDAARELAHQFFERVLDGRSFAAAEPGHGRFRSYLLGAVKHFVAETVRNARTAKRGGGRTPELLEDEDGHDTATGPQLPDPAGFPPDAQFDRHWATTVVDRAAGGLAAEYAARGQAGLFTELKPWLLGEVPTLSRAEAGRRLGLRESALRVAIHRLRKRFRELARAEIAQTVSDPTEVAMELRYLVEVLAQGEVGDSPP
jgi:RNA polymerase sigma-70 factor (ECF subfamily)